MNRRAADALPRRHRSAKRASPCQTACVSRDLWTLLGLIVSGAAVPVVHLSLAFAVLRLNHLGWPMRIAGLLPPLTPFFAWRAGLRRPVVLWFFVLLCYAALRGLTS
ncbi:MAG: hypothetical protein AAF550_01420 [Myxococcota bacterium]